MLKRVLMGLISLGVTSTLLAGAPGNQMAMPSGDILSAPESNSAWSFGLQALYAQIGSNGFQYTQINDNSAPLNTFTNKSVDNPTGWAGEADVTYHFSGNSRDITLGYTHLDVNQTNKTTLSGAETFSSSLGSVADQAKGQTDIDHNALDLTLGQQLLVGSVLVLHPFAGLRYADIDQDNKVDYTDSSTLTNTGTGKNTSDFQGIGPRAGLDVRVLAGAGVSFVGTMGGSLLVGSLDAHQSSTSSSVNLKTSPDDHTQIVPELDAKIGLDYTPHKLFPGAAVGFQVGYELAHYYNAASMDGFDATLVNSTNNNTDFSYQGPYMRIQLNIL